MRNFVWLLAAAYVAAPWATMAQQPRNATEARQAEESRRGQAQQAELVAETLDGRFEDGTYWRIQMPKKWNGSLFMDMDGAGFTSSVGGKPTAGPTETFNAWLLSQGYALAGGTREPLGYDYPKIVAHLVDVKRMFSEKYGKPKRTFMKGVSRGAFAVRLALEMRPDQFDGGVLSAGGGAGELGVLNNKLNGVFVLKTLVDPASPMKLVNIDLKAEQAALDALVAKANSTPQGRARLALAAAVQQFALWVDPMTPRPAPTDYDAQLNQVAGRFAGSTMLAIRARTESLVGGGVSWNHGVDYTRLLRISGRQAMVEALYKKAGLSLKDDLATLARAPRIRADPAAVRRAEPLMTYTGKLKGPLVNLDNEDPVEAVGDKLAYLQTVRKAGAADNFLLIWNDVAGHAMNPDVDRAVSVKLLENKVDTGKWGDTSVPTLRKMAAEIGAASPIPLGTTQIFDPGKVPPPPSTWDASNWGSYR